MAQYPPSSSCDEVNTYINPIKSWAEICPFRPEVDFGKSFLVERVFKEVCSDESLEKFAFSILGIGVLADVIEGSVESVICFLLPVPRVR